MFHQPDTTNTCNKLFFFRKTVLLWFSSTWVWISFKFIVLSHGFALQSFYRLTTKNYIITEAGIIKYLICIRAVLLFMFEEEMLADEEYQVLCSTISRDIIFLTNVPFSFKLWRLQCIGWIVLVNDDFYNQLHQEVHCVLFIKISNYNIFVWYDTEIGSNIFIVNLIIRIITVTSSLATKTMKNTKLFGKILWFYFEGKKMGFVCCLCFYLPTLDIKYAPLTRHLYPDHLISILTTLAPVSPSQWSYIGW